MEQLKLFDENFKKIVGDKLQFLQFDAGEIKELELQQDNTVQNANPISLSCSYCRVKFENIALQREHYKLDWHRYNLKQSLLARPSVTEEEFNDRTGDISSISGSDSSEEEENLESIATAQGKVFLQSVQGRVFAMYRCLLFEKKEELDDEALLQRLQTISGNPKWTLLMLGGGHFAGGIFEKDNPILHKTFHCYTVRAGQGGAQGSRDNKSGGSHPKSAGASLRRYNENAVVQHVKNIVEAWKDHIAQSSVIIYRAAGPYNRGVLFSGKTPLLNKNDSRLRTIPFSTRRATFTELKRVHGILTTLNIYDSAETALHQLPKHCPDSPAKRNKVKQSHINRAKSREHVERPLPGSSLSSSGSEYELDLCSSNQEVSFQELQTFQDTLTPEQRRAKKTKSAKKSKSQKAKEREVSRKKQFYDLIKEGHLQQLTESIEQSDKNKCRSEDSKENTTEEGSKNIESSINEVLDENGNTLLHVAALHEKAEVVEFLLRNGADPCKKNNKQQTPYTSTQSKEIRTVFKEFAQEFPERHNYNKANIPKPLPPSEQQLEKKMLQRKAKRDKEKEKKKQNAIKKQEETEKERFLNLSDREKRALAAERRILSTSGAVISRCFLCALDITGKVPFEYSEYRFCSPECLKAHRLQNSAALPR